MKASELRSKSAGDLAKQLSKQVEKHASLRQEQITKGGVKPHEFKKIRRNIARLKTVTNEPESEDKKSTGEKDA